MKFQYQAIDGKALVAFQPNVVDGTLEWEEGNTNGIIIPASIARTYFEGETAVAGRAMFVTEDSVTVRGVYEDFPDNCCMGNNIYKNLGDQELNVLNNLNYVCRLSESADTAAVCQAFVKGFTSKMKQWWFDKGWGEYWDDSTRFPFRLLPRNAVAPILRRAHAHLLVAFPHSPRRSLCHHPRHCQHPGLAGRHGEPGK